MGRVVQFLNIILLVLIIYFAMIYQYKREGFEEANTLVNPLEYPNGIAIKESGTGRYLMQNDDGFLTFTGLKLSTEYDSASDKQIDKCKFTLTRVGSSSPPRYKIKSYGHQLGQAGGNDLYWKDIGSGASNEFLQKIKAVGSFDDASLFTFALVQAEGTSDSPHVVVENDGVKLANNKYALAKINESGRGELFMFNIYIEHYVPTYIQTKDGDFNSVIGPSGIKAKQIYNCANGNGNSNLVGEFSVNNSLQCSRKCIESGNCNHYVYNYLQPPGDNNCSLYNNCTGNNLILNYNVRNNNDRGIIMNKVSASQNTNIVDKQQQELINSRLQTYDDSMQLMDENIKLMDQIKEKVNEINNMEIRGETNAYDHVINHDNVVDAINDPKNLSTLQYNIKNYIQKSTVTNLEQQLAELERLNEIKSRTGSLAEAQEINEIKSIQNVNNARSLNVYLPDDISRTDKENHEYMIFGNGKCLSYNNDGVKTGEYKFVDCNRRDNNQLFKIDKIGSSLAYNNKVANPINKIDSARFETLGFYAVSPKGDAKQCMTLNDDGLVIQPCDLDSEQRYQVSDKIVSC